MNKRKKEWRIATLFSRWGRSGAKPFACGTENREKTHKNATILYSLLTFSLGGEIF